MRPPNRARTLITHIKLFLKCAPIDPKSVREGGGLSDRKEGFWPETPNYHRWIGVRTDCLSANIEASWTDTRSQPNERPGARNIVER